MPAKRKLGRSSAHRKSLFNNLVTSLIVNGKIQTTEQKAKEIKPIIDSIISLAVREKDNFEMVEKKVSSAKLDKNGKKVTEKVTSKNGNAYTKIVREITTKQVQKDMPSRLAARRKMMKTINKVKDEKGNSIDAIQKLFDEIAPKYENIKGGYTRIIKTMPRKGDNAAMAIIEFI